MRTPKRIHRMRGCEAIRKNRRRSHGESRQNIKPSKGQLHMKNTCTNQTMRSYSDSYERRTWQGYKWDWLKELQLQEKQR